MKKLLVWLVLLSGAASATWWNYPPARELAAPYLPAWINQLAPVETAKAPEPKRKGPPPAPVTAATVTLADMPILISAPGTVETKASIAVKPRVDGQIAEVLFKEGDLVEKDQVLYRLDDRLIKAQILQAESTVKRDQASLVEAEANYGRRSTLVQKKIVSEAAMDTAKTSVETLKANIAAGKAAVEAQKTQLDYLTIRAPLTGRTGASAVKAGANVRAADLLPLVTINQTRPVFVAFAVPQSEIATLRRAMASGAGADVVVAGTRPETRQGRLEFIDNQVDKQTGTLTAKLEVENKDELLWPGLAVEVVLRVEVRKDMLAVPAAAVVPSQQGMIVWVIGADSRVQPRPVQLERIVAQTAYLSGGVAPGDRVVTDGQVRVSTGAPVSVQEPGGPAGKGEKGKGGERGKGEKGSAPKADGAKSDGAKTDAGDKAGGDKGQLPGSQPANGNGRRS